ncbi:hypothetical protein OG874_05900 [Nocardia sp. NBC_00565]|nr:hypothetical protein [Nocardia sp. NBC_00565]WUC04708.1 hypothetical protein OG874_05900 [Nocardia sp. NBC_00565]
MARQAVDRLGRNLRGDIRSAFAITESWVAGTDLIQIQSTAVLDGDE